MKNFNDTEKARQEVKANLEGCGICCDVTMRTAWFGGNERPNSYYREGSEGLERVLITDGICLDLGIGKDVYVMVEFDSISIWIVNPEKQCYEFENVFWNSDYKNKTMMQMALACELLNIANSVKEG